MGQQSLPLRMINILAAGILMEVLIVAYIGRALTNKIEHFLYVRRMLFRWIRLKILPERRALRRWALHKAREVSEQLALASDQIRGYLPVWRAKTWHACRMLLRHAENPFKSFPHGS